MDFNLNKIDCSLSDQGLWDRFFKVGTEMIITKGGRRMFPSVKFNINQLDPKKQYSVLFDIVAVDTKRYKFYQGQWQYAVKPTLGASSASNSPGSQNSLNRQNSQDSQMSQSSQNSRNFSRQNSSNFQGSTE